MRTFWRLGEPLSLIAGAVMVAVAIWRGGHGYISALLVIFFCIWTELRMIRHRLPERREQP